MCILDRFFFSGCISLLFIGGLPASLTAQNSSKVAPGNWWMKEADNAPGTTVVSPIVRYDRDNFFDHAVGSMDPLTPETAQKSHISEGAVYGVPP